MVDGAKWGPRRARGLSGIRSCLVLTLALVMGAGCGKGEVRGTCGNATCVCDPGVSCTIDCVAPPCTAVCAGQNPSCSGQCANGDCTCGPGSTCTLACKTPPCHAYCDRGSSCGATCANGACECAAGASCAFTCSAGPCHVDCQGNNPRCDGACANGSCTCGSGSTCAFQCLDDTCHVECGAGAHCLLACPKGNAGAGCNFSTCASGAPAVCRNGLALACGTECPP